MNSNLQKKIWLDKNFFIKDIDLTRCYTHLNCSVPLHSHTFTEINIIVAGNGIHHIYNKDIPVHRGNIYIIPTNTAHSYSNQKGLNVRHILIADNFFNIYNNELNSLLEFSTLFNIQPFLPNLNTYFILNESQLETIDSFWKILEKNSLTNDRIDSRSNEDCVISNTLVLSIISFLCKEYHITKQTLTKETFEQSLSLYKAIEYITNNYSEKISTSLLAKICNMSESTFFRTFKNIIHSTPMDYLTGQRILHAKILLKNSEFSITTIAQNTGFFDSAHFSKTFRKVTGITPLAYRHNDT